MVSGADRASFSNKFTSSFLPVATSFGSSSRAFQSNFPNTSIKPLSIDPSGSDVIVLQPGSRYMKIGFANQAFPKIVPHVLAKKTSSPQFDSTDERNSWQLDEDEIQERITQRYRQSRRKPPPNIYQSVKTGQSEYEEISAHNDAFLMEWTDENSNKIHVGTAALHLNPDLPYKLVWPLQRGTFNSRDYSHVREVIEDLGQLWRGAIKQELEVDDFGKYCLVLILPDSFDRAFIKGCVETLMNSQKPFRAVTVIQESQAVAFGCGVSSALVIDCGAQKISLACIEEGFLVPETKIKIPIGGDDVTRFFAELLKLHEFPHEFDLRKPLDWELLDELKQRCCTVNEAEIAPSAAIFEFYVRKPEELTRKFLFKMFEERIIAPLALFDEEMSPFLSSQMEEENVKELFIDGFDLEDTFIEPSNEEQVPVVPGVPIVADSCASSPSSVSCNWDGCKESFDEIQAAIEHFDSSHETTERFCKFPKCSFNSTDKLSFKCHVLSHLACQGGHGQGQQKKPKIDFEVKLKENFDSPMSMDDAAIASLLRLGETERIKRCASSIILSGGSHLFPGFPDLLLERLLTKLPLNPLTSLVEAKIFPNARDLDARFLAWKGGAVFSKLESTSTDSWITRDDWNNFNSRSIKDKISFIN